MKKTIKVSKAVAFKVTKSDMDADEVVFDCGNEEKHFYSRTFGEWIDEGTYCSTMSKPIEELHSFKCPLCDNSFVEWTYNISKHQFCGWCGAEMKKEVK